MTRYAIVRLTNSHAEPLRGNLIQLYEAKDDALAAGRDALPQLANGGELAVVAIVGRWQARTGHDYIETVDEDSPRLPLGEPGLQERRARTEDFFRAITSDT